jgi:hypothetical protein
MFGKQLGGDSDRSGEHRPRKESNQGNGDGGNDELRDQPEDKLEGDRQHEEDDNRKSFADAFVHKPKYDSTNCYTGPETRGDKARLNGAAVTDLHHELDDPATN